MTLYRGMDIGTAKLTEVEREGVPHHLIDVLDPWQSASVADYRQWAASVLEDLAARGKRGLFVGGTPLYLKACLRGLFEGPAAAPGLREELERQAEAQGEWALWERLRELDPATAARLHVNDRRRVIRAIEVVRLTGRPLSALQQEHDQAAPATVPVYAIQRPREVLRGRINERVVSMFASGLVEEVERLRSLTPGWNAVPAQGVGYLEVSEMLGGRMSRSEAVERTQARTRQFAKRQETWFRGLAEVCSFPVEEGESARRIAERLRVEILPKIGW
jgi:tRNA dimethylallyltransferase